MKGKQVEVSSTKHEIIVTRNLDLDNDESKEKYHYHQFPIDCWIIVMTMCHKGGIGENKTQVATKYIPRHLRNTNEVMVPKKGE